MSAIELQTEAPASRPLLARPWVSGAVAAISLGAAVIGLVLGLRPSAPGALVDQNLPGTVATFVLAVLLTVVGIVLRRRDLEHTVGWLLLLFGLTSAGTSLVWGITYIAGLPGGDRALGTYVAWAGAIVSAPSWTYLATALVVRFPSGAPESAVDARLLRISGYVCLIAAAFATIRPGEFLIYPAYSNPLTLPSAVSDVATVLAPTAVITALAILGIAALGMVGRYRRAAQVERLQLKWFAFATLVALLGGSVYFVFGVLLAPDNVAIRDTTYVVQILAICSLPIAVLEAITRHRLYDIDRIIGRAFAYGALTAILAGLYAASLRLFNALFVTYTGENSEAALILTTLVLATTFTPIKTRLEKLAARRFPPETPGADQMSAPGPPPDPELDARIEAAVRRAVDAALRERDSRTGVDSPPS